MKNAVKTLKPLPSEFNYTKWLKIAHDNLKKRFPNAASMLIEEAVAQAFDQISDAKSPLTFTLNSLKFISNRRLIDLKRQLCHRLTEPLDTAFEKKDPLSWNIPTLSGINDLFDQNNDQNDNWNHLVWAVAKIQNPRRKALLETYFHAKMGYIAPEKHSIRQLKIAFNMPSEQSVRTEIHRGLANLRDLLAVTKRGGKR